MKRYIMISLSAIIAAIIAGGGAFFGVVSGLEPNAKLSDIGSITWLVIGVTALIAAAKDLKTYLADAPKPNPTNK